MTSFFLLTVFSLAVIIVVIFFCFYGFPNFKSYPEKIANAWIDHEMRRLDRIREEDINKQVKTRKAKEDEQERYEEAQRKLYSLERQEILDDINCTRALRLRRRAFQHDAMDVWERELAYLEGKLTEEEYLQLKDAEDLKYGAIETAKQQYQSIPPPGPSNRTIDSLKPLPSYYHNQFDWDRLQLIAVVNRIQDRNGDFPGGGFKTDEKRLEQLAFREKAMKAVEHYKKGHTTAQETLYHIHQVADAFGYK